jgi:two-component system, NarL family, sensor kinase
MPDNQYNEVLIVLIACIALFLVLAAIILLFLFLYQRRRFTQKQQVAELELQFREQSLKAQVEIQEQTFVAISREIHDNVGQILSLAKVQINVMNESETMDRKMLEDVRDNIGKAMSDLRGLARSLSSDRIESWSLQETLAQEVDRINKTGLIRAEVAIEGSAREIEPRKKLILFRTIQESIQNCLRHAEATRISIRLCYQVDGIQVSIQDNGKGFDTEAVLQREGGLGLNNIRTRMRLAGGGSVIESVLHHGTSIYLTIPYE